MKKYIFSIVGMIAVIVGLTVLQAVVANSVSTVGVDISKVDEEIHRYKKENALLKEQLLTASSYTTIAEEVENRGFEPSSKQLTLTNSLPLALR